MRCLAQNNLLISKDFHSFLRLTVTERGAQAHLCRLAGFSSRSYLSELISGKKGLSRDSVARLKTALKLPKAWGHLFELLAWDYDPRLRPTGLGPDDVQIKIKNQRAALTKLTKEKNQKPDSTSCIHSPYLFQVYAALGLPEEGATQEQVISRARLKPQQVEKFLNQLLSLGTIVKQNDRYFAPVSQADALSLKDPTDLSEMIRLTCNHIQKNRNRIVQDPNNLTFYSAFSVSRNQLPALKQKIQSALLDVLDEFQNDQGDHVEQLFVSLQANPFTDQD